MDRFQKMRRLLRSLETLESAHRQNVSIATQQISKLLTEREEIFAVADRLTGLLLRGRTLQKSIDAIDAKMDELARQRDKILRQQLKTKTLLKALTERFANDIATREKHQAASAMEGYISFTITDSSRHSSRLTQD